MSAQMIGLGDDKAAFQVFIANRPPLAEYQQLRTLQPLQRGDIARIASDTGNHWRKIFNVYAKLICALQQAGINGDNNQEMSGFTRWQDLRDQQLLQADSGQALLFSPPQLNPDTTKIRLLLAKSYAQTLGLSTELIWLDNDFALHPSSGIVVCPYFDYRQLSDIKIQRLVGWLKQSG
ncbi:MAG: hypothetical protein LRY66_15010 [Saccharospirillaceae bacterium]|nr:hypothetical protein [Saccharospirillaceae bacterium]MCD8532618.1 hypothetical protein [Saccharospirillaceae bacterium]